MARWVRVERGAEGNFTENEGEYWQNLTEGEVFDLDLFTACATGDFDYVNKYLTTEANSGDSSINKKNTGGWTPLMYACYVGQDKILDLLIREGADILAEDEKRGMTPLMLASSSGNTSVVKRLLKKNTSDLNAVDKKRQTALFHATEQGHLNVIRLLLRNDADVLISQSGSGYTPFMEAARQGNKFNFNAFLEHGIDLSTVCNNGLTCRDLAYQTDAMVIVNMIDNHCMQHKSESLREEPGLGVLYLGVDNIQQPREKVHDWLNEHNPGVFSEAKVFDDIVGPNQPEYLANKQSHPVSIEYDYTRNPASDVYGKSIDTLLDSDRTPVGTPVDSIFQQYMTGEAKHFGRYVSDTLPRLDRFLEELCLEKYKTCFDDEDVDFRILISLTEDDFKDLDIKLGPRRKLQSAITKWKQETGWVSKGKLGEHEVDSLKLQLAEVFAKLQQVTNDYFCEKEASSQLKAEQMEERVRRSHMYFISEKLQQSCQELQNYSKHLRELIKTLETAAITTSDNNEEDLRSKIRTLHKQMNDDVDNTDNVVDVILRRIRKMMSDDIAALSSGSNSPESSCTSFSKSESSIAYSH